MACAPPNRSGACIAQREGRGNAEGLRRLLLAIIRDLRVVLVLLALQLVRLRAAVERLARGTSRARPS